MNFLFLFFLSSLEGGRSRRSRTLNFCDNPPDQGPCGRALPASGPSLEAQSTSNHPDAAVVVQRSYELALWRAIAPASSTELVSRLEE
jgi:hypothetical protein